MGYLDLINVSGDGFDLDSKPSSETLQVGRRMEVVTFDISWKQL